MKQLKATLIARLKRIGYDAGKIDYSMNSCYYRTVLGTDTLCASVDPRIAAHATTGYAGSTVWEIKL